MSDDQLPNRLPTELITAKNFYSLGGASAAVLLTCWAINYVAVDVSWLNYKIYRLIAIILSETFAVTIMFQSEDRKPVRWLFAFLNGLLIFVNASGLNVMTSSYIFNPENPHESKPVSFYHFQEFNSDENMQAGIFPLPRMTNWWPDEKLALQKQELETENEKLSLINQKLLVEIDLSEKNSDLLYADSLQLLKTMVHGFERRQDSLISLLDKGSSQNELTRCEYDLRKCKTSLNECDYQVKLLQDQLKHSRDTIRKIFGKPTKFGL